MTSERDLEALAEQWDRDANGCDRDGYRDAAIVKRDCARRLRELVARLQPARDDGEVVVTRDEDGEIVMVCRQDAEGRVIKIIATTTHAGGKPARVPAHAVPASVVREYLDARACYDYASKPSGSHTCWKCNPAPESREDNIAEAWARVCCELHELSPDWMVRPVGQEWDAGEAAARAIHRLSSAQQAGISDWCRTAGCVHAAHGCPTWKAGENPFAQRTGSRGEVGDA